MTKIVTLLQRLGFGEYEARAYVALLKRNPLNGYELAKASGLPRANIYAVLQKLEERGAVVRLDTLAKAEKVYELTTPSHTENLEMIRNFISRLAQKAGLNEMAAMEIEVAVEEACVNAIKHAHKSDQAKPLRLQIKIDKQKLTVLVRDEGQGFDPKQLDEQNARELLAKPQNGGRGILMMKMLMDEVHFEAGNGKGMQVRLVKHLASPQKENIH